jgi:hypothetical protein
VNFVDRVDKFRAQEPASLVVRPDGGRDVGIERPRLPSRLGDPVVLHPLEDGLHLLVLPDSEALLVAQALRVRLEGADRHHRRAHREAVQPLHWDPTVRDDSRREVALGRLAQATVVKVDLLQARMLGQSKGQSDRTGNSKDVARQAKVCDRLASHEGPHETDDASAANLVETEVQPREGSHALKGSRYELAALIADCVLVKRQTDEVVLK